MNIVLAGDWHSNVHERPLADALRRLGHEVTPFAWHGYVSGGAPLVRKLQNKYLAGPLLRRINADLVALVRDRRPDLLFVYRGTHITAASLRDIRKVSPGTLIVGYNNDDPFAAGQSKWPWRHFLAAIPEYDRVFAYRRHNIAELRAAGARATGLLLPWFVPALHHPRSLDAEDRARFGSEVTFIGHFENDGRLQCLEALAQAGIDVRIFGPRDGYRGHDWETPLRDSAALRHLNPYCVWDEDYAKALCGARIALCFLSKRNRDVYTRRCFEIPATGTLLMSEYSDELNALFAEGVHADYFRSPVEIVTKARRYLADDGLRRRVAAAGLARVHADGHDVDSRARTMIDTVFEGRARKATA